MGAGGRSIRIAPRRSERHGRGRWRWGLHNRGTRGGDREVARVWIGEWGARRKVARQAGLPDFPAADRSAETASRGSGQRNEAFLPLSLAAGKKISHWRTLRYRTLHSAVRGSGSRRDRVASRLGKTILAKKMPGSGSGLARQETSEADGGQGVAESCGQGLVSCSGGYVSVFSGSVPNAVSRLPQSSLQHLPQIYSAWSASTMAFCGEVRFPIADHPSPESAKSRPVGRLGTLGPRVSVATSILGSLGRGILGRELDGLPLSPAKRLRRP